MVPKTELSGLVENMPSQTSRVWWTMETNIHTRQQCAFQREEHTGARTRKACMWNTLMSDHKAVITPKPKYGSKEWTWVHKQLPGPKTVTQSKWNKLCTFCDRQELIWLMIKEHPRNKWQWWDRKVGRKYANPSYISRIKKGPHTPEKDT